MLLDLGGQVSQPHDLRDPDAADALPTGDGGLVGGLARLEERLPLEGFAEELGHPGYPRHLGRLGLAPGRWDGAYNPVGRHPACQGADVAVLKGPVGPQSDLDRLLAVGHRGAVADV